MGKQRKIKGQKIINTRSYDRSDIGTNIHIMTKNNGAGSRERKGKNE